MAVKMFIGPRKNEDGFEEMICRTPVVVERTGPLEVWVRFSNRWFGGSPEAPKMRLKLLEILRNIEYPENFMVSAMASTVAVAIYVRSDDALNESTEATLDHLVQRLIREALRFFGKASRDQVKKVRTIPVRLEDLCLPYDFHEVFAELDIGLANGLSNYTREEVCNCRRAQTNDVRVLESRLAAFGIFLKSSPLPPYGE